MMQINSISRQNELYTNSTESNGQNRTISDTPSSKEHIGVEISNQSIDVTTLLKEEYKYENPQ